MVKAADEVGQAERPGRATNPRIEEYLRCTRLDERALIDDETAWCAGFVCWCLEKSQHKNPRYAMAKNFAKYGDEVAPDALKFGDILVFERNENYHVCFYVRDIGADVEVLGGNQRNSVCFTHRPKSGIYARRRPVRE